MNSAGTPRVSTAELDAARLILERMGITVADLTSDTAGRRPAPTFGEYIPIVAAAVGDGSRRVYGSYWNRITQQWADRRLTEPTASEILQLAEYVRTHVVQRRNGRGGRCAAEHLVAAIRCVYNHAVADGLISESDNVARKVAKPRRLPSPRRAVADAAWRRSTTLRRQPATIPPWTRCCCGCTPRPHVVVAAR